MAEQTNNDDLQALRDLIQKNPNILQALQGMSGQQGVAGAPSTAAIPGPQGPPGSGAAMPPFNYPPYQVPWSIDPPPVDPATGGGGPGGWSGDPGYSEYLPGGGWLQHPGTWGGWELPSDPTGPTSPGAPWTPGGFDASSMSPVAYSAMVGAKSQVEAARIQAMARLLGEPMTAYTRERAKSIADLQSIARTGIETRETESAKSEEERKTLEKQIMGELSKIYGQKTATQQIEATKGGQERLTAQQTLEAQLGLGDFGPGDGGTDDDYSTGVIGQTQKAQAQREKELSELAAAQQLGIGDYSTSGGIIEAEAEQARKTQEEQLAAKYGAKAGAGEDPTYRDMGELAATQALQKKSADEQQARLNAQQAKIAGLLGNVNNPIMNMFGMSGVGQIQPPANAEAAAGGLAGVSPLSSQPGMGNMQNMFNLAGQGQMQGAAMSLLQGGANPYDVSSQIPGMIGGGPQSLLARQGAYDAANTLGNQAAQQYAQSGLQAGQNIGQQFNQQLSNMYAMQQPFAAAAGQMAGAIPQAYGQSLAQLANVS